MPDTNAVAAAGQMGPEVHVLVAGSNAGEAAQSAAAIQGVAKVLQAEDAAYGNWLAEDIAPLVVKLAPNYSHIVMAADSCTEGTCVYTGSFKAASTKA